jgi:hypothetical protein
MNDDLKTSLALLAHQPAFLAFMEAINNAREAEIAQLGSDAVVGNPQTLAAVAGAVRAYDNVRGLWADALDAAKEA